MCSVPQGYWQATETHFIRVVISATLTHISLSQHTHTYTQIHVNTHKLFMMSHVKSMMSGNKRGHELRSRGKEKGGEEEE